MMEQAQQQEQLRQQYLTAMGVTTWLPVRPLPGAAPSPTWHWSTPNPSAPARPAAPPEREVVQAPPSSQPSAPKPPRADIQQLLADPSLRGDSRRPPARVPAPEPPTPEAAPLEAAVEQAPAADTARARGEIPRFRLALIRYPDCLVVDELPLQSLQGFSSAHRALLGRILASVGLGGGEPQVQAFAWPLVNAPHVDQSEAVARGGVNTVLWRVQQGATLPLLLLGEAAARYVLDPESPRTPGSWCENGDAPWSLVSHSLGELLKVPGRKRELWEHLRPLRARR